MPPKRKASSAVTENEPPRIRRRTRSTVVAAGELAEAPVVVITPAKKTSRSAKAEKKATSIEDTAQTLTSAASSTNVATNARRTSRVTTRSRKTETTSEDVGEVEPSAPKRRGRPKKTQPAEREPPAPPEPSMHRHPPSPIPESTSKEIPKKRGRRKKAEGPADSGVLESTAPAQSSRLIRQRRAQPAISTNVEHLTTSENVTTTLRKNRGGARKSSSPVGRPGTALPAVDEDSSEDELLLTPSKRALARPTTPTRTGESHRIGTPRMVMHSVEIATPRRLLNTVRHDLGSPGPRAHIPPLGTPRLPPAFPLASPRKGTVQVPPPSASRARAGRTPSPKPSCLEPLRSPSKTSPSKRARSQAGQPEDDLPKVLPPHLQPMFDRQKRAVLRALQRPPEIDEIDVYGDDYPPTNRLAYEQLSDLLVGTVARGEGNSCLLIGASGSGKTQMVEQAIAALPGSPIIVRLSGYAQQNDRLAIREIAWQLAKQTGQSFLPAGEEDEDDEEHPDAIPLAANAPKDADDNPFIDPPPAANSGISLSVTLPLPAHLLALISMIPTLPRPTIIVLDGFDLFAAHARQALLYCLLDTAQACRAGPATAAAGMRSASGMAVIGVTARVDTINLLEKRVKSRFSGRMIRTACPAKVGHWVALTRAVLAAPLESDDGQGLAGRRDAWGEWQAIWAKAVEKFLGDEAALDALRETYALTRDYQMLRRILTSLTMALSLSSPYPTAAKLEAAVTRQRCPSRFPPLHTLTYPEICLVIAAVHAQTSGHDVFTFEMLHEAFKNQVRTSQSAPVHVEGGGIGMVRCSREVLFAAFERLADLRIFLPAATAGGTVGREFALYRSAVDRFAVKKAVETIGQLNLKKWFTKAQ